MIVSSDSLLEFNDPRLKLRTLVLVAGILLLLLLLLVGVAAGSADISWRDVLNIVMGNTSNDNYRIIYHLRIPRVLCAALVGANLALSGCILQGLLKNPLADPGIIGVTAGAGLAAMALMLIAPQLTSWVPFAAFGGALIAVVAVFVLAWNHGVEPLRLILAGVALAAFFGGGQTALTIFYSERIQGTVNWLAGGFGNASWQYVKMILPYSFVGILAALCSYRQLNALQLGDEVASSLGINIMKTRVFLILVAALLAGSAVSVAGLLGFVGLLVPHIMRIIVGSDFEYLLPVSAIFGGVLLVGADTAARTLFQPLEVPVGLFLSFLGAPFFLYLLKRRMN